jgi:hypothetical protein
VITISKDEIRRLLKGWGFNKIEDLENALERELTDDEFKELIFHSMGYADYSIPTTLLGFVEFVNLTDYLSKEEVKALEDLELKSE